MAILGINSLFEKEASLGGFNTNGKGAFRLATRTDTGSDEASFSTEALNKLQTSGTTKAGEGIKGTKVVTSLGDKAVEFDSASGKLSVGGVELKLKQGKFANGLTDNLAVGVNTDGTFTVNNLSTGKSATFGSNGEMTTKTVMYDKDGQVTTDATKKDSEKTQPDIKEGSQVIAGDAVTLVNAGTDASGKAAAGSRNVVINRAASAIVTGGSGDDKLFNLNASAASINGGGGGNDAVYTKGLTSGTAKIDVQSASGNAYVKLMGNMKGGSVNLGGDTTLLDASGKTLNGTTVSGSGATSAVVAGTLAGASGSVNLNAVESAVDLKRVNLGSVTMGTGSNSLVIDSVTGNASGKAKITTNGNDTLKIGNMANAELNQSSNKSSWMKLVKGMSNGEMKLGNGDNSIDATKASFNKTSITQTGGTGGTAISAKNFNGDKTSSNNITLQGDGNMVTFSGTVQNAKIELGAGANTLNMGSVNNAVIKAAAGSTKSTADQNITVAKAAKNMTYEGSDGDDNLSFGGGVTDSSFDLGGGDNTFTAVKVNDKTGASKAQNLTNVNMSAGTTGTTTVEAGSLLSKGGASSSLTLGGTANVTLGTVGKNASISLGTGSNTLNVASIAGSKTAKVNIKMGLDSSLAQTLTVGKSTKFANIDFGTASISTVSAGGSMSDSTLNLGGVSNSVTLRNEKGKDQNLTNMVITAGETASTTITAKNFGGNARTSSALSLGSGTNNLSFSGTITQNTKIELGSGANTLSAKSIAGSKKAGVSVSIAQTVGAQDTSVSNSLTLSGGAKFLTYTGNSSADTLKFGGAVNNSSLDVGAGSNSLTAESTNKKGVTKLQALNNTLVRGAKGDKSTQSSMTMNIGTLGKGSNLELNGDNVVTLGSVAAGNTIDLGAGSSSLTITNGVKGTAKKQVTIQFGTDAASNSTNTQTVRIEKGGATGLNYKGSKGDDNLTIIGGLKNSTVDLGSGANTLSVQTASSTGATITNSTIKSTEAGSTNTIFAGKINSSGKGTTVLDLTGGSGNVTVGDVSGKTTISMGTGSSTFSGGKFSGKNVRFTSLGDGTFITTNIVSGATVDFSNSTNGGSVTIGTTTGGMNDANIKLGTNAVTILAGGATHALTGTASDATNAGTANMQKVNISGTNATSVTINAKDILGASVLDLGGTTSITANDIKGTTSIKAGTGSFTLTANNIGGTASDKRVNIDAKLVKGTTGTSVTVTGDASNFTMDTGNSTSAVTATFGSINQKASGSKAPGATITSTNAITVDLTVTGGAKKMDYTGSTGADTVVLGGEILNSTIELGGGTNTVRGTDANTAAGAMTNVNITDGTGADTTLQLSSYNSSGSSGGKISTKGDSVTLTTTSKFNGDLDLNSGTVDVTMGGSFGSDSGKIERKATLGSNAETVNFTLNGGGKGFNISGANNTASYTVTLNGAIDGKVDIAGATNSLTIGSGTNGATVTKLVASLGNDKDTTKYMGSVVNVGTDSSSVVDITSMDVTFKGTAGHASADQHRINAGGTLANTNITNLGGTELTVDAGGLTNVNANLNDSKNSTFTIGGKIDGLNVNVTAPNKTASGASTGTGILSVGTANVTEIVNLHVTSAATAETKLLGKTMKDSSVSTSGDVTFGTGTAGEEFTDVQNVTVKTANDKDVTMNTKNFDNLTVSNAKDLTFGAAATGGGTLNVNLKGNLSGDKFTSLGELNATVAGTLTLGDSTKATTNTFGNMNIHVGGAVDISGASFGSVTGSVGGTLDLGDATATYAGTIDLSKLGGDTNIKGKTFNGVKLGNVGGDLTIGEAAATTKHSGDVSVGNVAGTATINGSEFKGVTVGDTSGGVAIGSGGGASVSYAGDVKVGNVAAGGVLINGKSFQGVTVGTSVGNVQVGVSGATYSGNVTVGNVTADGSTSDGDVLIYGKSFKDVKLGNVAGALQLGSGDSAATYDNISVGTVTAAAAIDGKLIKSISGNFASTLTMGNDTSGSETSYGTVNVNVTGAATIKGNEITSGGTMNLEGTSTVAIKNTINNLNVNNNGTGKVTVGVSGSTVHNNPNYQNKSTGELETLGKNVSGGTIDGSTGKLTVDLTEDFNGTLKDGATAGTIDVRNFTGAGATTLKKSTLTATGSVNSQVVVNGGNLVAGTLNANASIVSGSLFAGTQNAGTTISADSTATKAGALISVGTQNGNINGGNADVHSNTVNGSIVMGDTGGVMIGNVAGTGRVNAGSSSLDILNAVNAGATVTVKDQTAANAIKFGSGGVGTFNTGQLIVGSTANTEAKTVTNASALDATKVGKFGTSGDVHI